MWPQIGPLRENHQPSGGLQTSLHRGVSQIPPFAAPALQQHRLQRGTLSECVGAAERRSVRPKTMDVGLRPQLLLDPALVARAEGVARTVHPARTLAEPVLRPDPANTWE